MKYKITSYEQVKVSVYVNVAQKSPFCLSFVWSYFDGSFLSDGVFADSESIAPPSYSVGAAQMRTAYCNGEVFYQGPPAGENEFDCG